MLREADVAPHLRTHRFGHALRCYARVPSTNPVAAAWAAEGAPEGALVLADYQTAGRGRHGRTWQADPGHNLTFSLVLRPRLPSPRLGLLPLAAALGVADALAPVVTPLVPAIKWPNDVLLEGHKCCGLLVETSFAAGAPEWVVLGLGLNVNQAHFPEGLEATSVLLTTGRSTPRGPLLASLLLHLERHYEALHTPEGADAVRTGYTARLHARGERVRLQRGTQRLEGFLEGIAPDGALCLRTPGGLLTLHAGEVSTVRAA